MCFKAQKKGEQQQLAGQAQQLKTNEQQVHRNDFSMMLLKELAGIFREKMAEQDEYFAETVDPGIKALAASGFLPGEEQRMRNEASEAVGRGFQQEEAGIRRDEAESGFTSSAPSGNLPARMDSMRRARGETGAGIQRDISRYGAEQRRGGLGMALNRGSLFNPQQWMGLAMGNQVGQAGGVQNVQYNPGIFGSFIAPMIKGAAASASSWLGKT